MHETDGDLAQGFRVAEDYSLAGEHDEPYPLTDDVSVGIAHVLEMPAETQAAFGQILANTVITSPALPSAKLSPAA